MELASLLLSTFTYHKQDRKSQEAWEIHRGQRVLHLLTALLQFAEAVIKDGLVR